MTYEIFDWERNLIEKKLKDQIYSSDYRSDGFSLEKKSGTLEVFWSYHKPHSLDSWQIEF